MTIGHVVADGLAFPEGPLLLPDGRVVFTEIDGGRLSYWTPADGVRHLATSGGGPNGAALAADGCIYVTQNGGFGDERVTPGLQCIATDGTVSMLATEIDGVRLDAPNDLAFGPDGRLWFTDPRGDAAGENLLPGRLFVYDVNTGDGEVVVELEAVYPNGIGFADDGTLLWTESFSRRVMALSASGPQVVVELPDRHFPDGFCVGTDGRLYVASTYGHCVNVVADGAVVDTLMCGDGMPTNCCFVGTTLIVTESRRGTLWSFDLGVTGLPLHTGNVG